MNLNELFWLLLGVNFFAYFFWAFLIEPALQSLKNRKVPPKGEPSSLKPISDSSFSNSDLLDYLAVYNAMKDAMKRGEDVGTSTIALDACFGQFELGAGVRIAARKHRALAIVSVVLTAGMLMLLVGLFWGLFASNFESKARAYLNRKRQATELSAKNQTTSLTDELQTLSELFKSGAISQGEYTKAKERILNGAA